MQGMSQRDLEYSIAEYDSYTDLERCLLNDFQHDFPLSTRPFADIARRMNVSTDEVIKAIEKLQCSGAISRVGPVIRANSVGRSMLAALRVPEHRLVETATLVNAYAEVNHNYEREHRFNLWFVVTAADRNRLVDILNEIEHKCGYTMLRLPLLDSYHIDLGFDLKCS